MKKFKIPLILIIATLIFMVLGLILIATFQTKDGTGIINGFSFLNLNDFKGLSNRIGDILSNSDLKNVMVPKFCSSGQWLQLQFGVSFAVIVTPILLVCSIFSFVWFFCINYFFKKNQLTNEKKI